MTRRVYACVTLVLLAYSAENITAQKSGSTTNAGVSRTDAQKSIPSRTGIPQFRDIARQSGLTVSHISSPEKKYIVESMSGGIGLFDCDNDGKLDLVMVNGSTIERYRGGGDPMVTLYRQGENGRFTDITQSAGLTRKGWGMGVSVADFDNDGNLDLYVTGYGGNVLYRGIGGCKFEDVTEKAGIRGGGFSTGAAWADYDRDGYVDLFVSRYVHFDLDQLPEFGKGQHCVYKGVPVQCGPWGMLGETDLLYHNRGDGTFEEVSVKAGVHDPEGRYGLGAIWTDYDDDGWPDLFVANDAGLNYLYHNNHDGTFTDVALLSGVALSGSGQANGNMGIDFGDYDGSGRQSLFVTTFTEQSDILYRNLGHAAFDDVSSVSKIEASSYPLVGWGTGFFDMDNDGWPDIFVANGHVYPQMDSAINSAPYRQPMLLYHNDRDQTFEEVSAMAGLSTMPLASRRGVAFGDIFNTGNVDIAVLNLGQPPSLLLNQGAGGHSVLFKLQGTRSNRAAIGARVTMQAADLHGVGEVRAGGSYLSQNDLRIHFGLGSHTTLDKVVVRWPNGSVETFSQLAADRIYKITEGKGIQESKGLSLPPRDSSDNEQ